MLNQNITGIAFRSSATVTEPWPTATTIYPNYDIYMGKSVLVQNSTNFYAENESGAQTQVRSGSLTINVNDYPAGGASSWGPPIQFSTGYNYTGGNLAILIRHDASNGTTKANNALGVSTGGYNSLFKACWQGTYAGPGGTQGNFSVIRLSSGSISLPVALTNFNCSSFGYHARIDWETASEKNMKSYIIETSFDGIQFEAIHTLPVKTESITAKKYSYTDYNIFLRTETVFYRLKMVEADGSFKHSNVNKLNFGKARSGNLVVYPNPVTSIANISYTVSFDADVSFRIYDITGKEVYSDILKSVKGNNSILTDLGHLEKGYYILKLTGDGLEDSYKFLKN
ncbi:MAG: hypothetical protein BGO31_12860 [Bacteroidetes bacterium 43-16]|nr:MAG: hypothetical protein BGO31_12860 [Bacteroidetes bacterium 43-16]